MFGKKKESRQRSRPAGSLAQYGIFEVPENFDNLGEDLAIDDGDDLEAELAALTADNESNRKPQRKAPRKPISDDNLNKMVSESMKDINSDEELSDGEDDPDLLNELKLIADDGSEVIEKTPETEAKIVISDESNDSSQELIKLLEERLILYKKAEQKAKAENETSRVRRYGRGLKTLQEMLSHAQTGQSVNEADIPPVLPPSATSDATVDHTENTTGTNEIDNQPSIQNKEDSKAAPVAVDQEKLELLKKRQQEYKIAAVSWKKAGNMEEAMNHVKIAKQFDIVISALNAGEEVDLSDMPPVPAQPTAAINSPVSPESSEKEENQTQTGAAAEVPSSAEQAKPPSGLEDIESALKERLEVYRRTKAIAESEGNSSKARRYGRICKQFEDALKLHTRGKPIPLDELPIPPGFPPLSLVPQSNSTLPDVVKNDSDPILTPAPAPPPSEEDTTKSSAEKKSPVAPVRPNRARKPNQKITSRADKQLAELLQRQHELKQAALSAKKDGDLELARDYLRQSKGIQPLIEASKAGLPVDMNTVPLSPVAKMELSTHHADANNDDSFQLVSSLDCLEEATGTDEQIYENLESQLLKQIKWCLSTRDHSKALGDVSGYNRWERLALGYTRDLDMLRVRKRDSLPPPQHHYETKTYAIVQSCTDLNDGDVEISIIRGINYSREADTYVIYEFPYPTENSPTDRTSTVKGTRNPEYKAVFPLTDVIDRSSRQCQRAFKRHALKCQVWARGCSLNPILCCTHPRGFFRSDSLLGTVTIKLQPLESQCVIHDSFPLMEGRRATGGKLEVKIRLRNPIVTKQIEQITDKWLIIDQ